MAVVSRGVFWRHKLLEKVIFVLRLELLLKTANSSADKIIEWELKCCWFVVGIGHFVVESFGFAIIIVLELLNKNNATVATKRFVYRIHRVHSRTNQVGTKHEIRFQIGYKPIRATAERVSTHNALMSRQPL